MGQFRAQGSAHLPLRSSRGPLRTLPLLCAVALVGLLVVPSFGSQGTATPLALSASELGGMIPLLGSVTSNFTLNLTPIQLSSIFWGTTVTPRAHLLPLENELVNATPTQMIVWPGGAAGDDFNPITNTMYSVNSTTHALRSSTPPTSEAQFAAWCLSIRCSVIMQVPGEIDNASLAAEVVNYTEKTLGLHPSYWEIGNEPEVWKHWRLPWNDWSEGNLTITPSQYAWEVRNYTLILRQADPSMKIIGIPATGRPNGPWPVSDWVNATVRVNAANLSAVAFHDYPGGPVSGHHATLQSFYGLLNANPGLPARVSWVRNSTAATLQAVCPTCPPIPVFVTEVGSALSHLKFAQFSVGFPGALDMAAQMTQAMSLNLTNQDLFGAVADTSNSWFNLTGSARPDYIAYSQVLTHLGSEAFQVGLSGYNHTLFAIATLAPGDHDRQDLLVVNANVTSNVTFAPRFAEAGNANSTEIWQWNGTVQHTTANGTTWAAAQTPAPVIRSDLNGLPTNFTIPRQSLVLFEAYPSNATPVRFAASGLPNGTRWFVNVAGKPGATSGPNQTFFLPPGVYTVAAPAIPVPLGGLQPAPPERLQPFVATTIVVGQSPLVVPVPFVYQWRLNVTAEPSQGGTVVPAPEWANASQSLVLTAVPSSGYSFSHWFGWGPGSFNGTSAQATVRPTGSVSERAIFAPVVGVTFTESGLPNGRPWSVDLRGENQSSTDSNIVFVVTNGIYGFRIGDSPGYRAHPPAGSVNVSGTPLVVPIEFQPLTPPPPEFSVTFQESGLPSGTDWTVAMRGVSNSSISSGIGFNESNGTWGFQVGPVAGYRAHPPAGAVNVTGVPVQVLISFQPLSPPGALFTVTFVEVGLATGTGWSIFLRNESNRSTGGWLTFEATNGSYGYRVGSVPGYRTAAPNVGFVVGGAPTSVKVPFEPREYQVVWNETGLWKGLSWDVLVHGVRYNANGSWVTAELVNGSYPCRVQDSTDWVPRPSQPQVIVSGADEVVDVNFTRAEFAVTFFERGLPTNTPWSVRFADQNLSPVLEASDLTAGTIAPNGTYTFDVVSPSGYYPAPSHGLFTVHAGPSSLTITFLPSGPAPIPSIWSLGPKAMIVAVAIGLASWGGFALAGRARRPDREAGAEP